MMFYYLVENSVKGETVLELWENDPGDLGDLDGQDGLTVRAELSIQLLTDGTEPFKTFETFVSEARVAV